MSSTDPKVRQAALRRILIALMDKPCQIEEGLYLGSAAAAGRRDTLKALNITHVLIVARALEPSFPGEFEYKKVDVADSPAEDLQRHFDDCFGFIERARQGGGGVLVHCFAGVSRSAAVVMAYLMRKRGLSRPEAMALVASKRPRVAPNDGFVAQLDRYEEAIRGAG